MASAAATATQSSTQTYHQMKICSSGTSYCCTQINTTVDCASPVRGTRYFSLLAYATVRRCIRCSPQCCSCPHSTMTMLQHEPTHRSVTMKHTPSRMAYYNASSTQTASCSTRCLNDGHLPMGSNQINTQSAVIQILPLAMPNQSLLMKERKLSVGWPSFGMTQTIQSCHSVLYTADQPPSSRPQRYFGWTRLVWAVRNTKIEYMVQCYQQR